MPNTYTKHDLREQEIRNRVTKLEAKFFEDPDKPVYKLYDRLTKDLTLAEVDYFNFLLDISGIDI